MVLTPLPDIFKFLLVFDPRLLFLILRHHLHRYHRPFSAALLIEKIHKVHHHHFLRIGVDRFERQLFVFEYEVL
jgi:hypothetical protein